MPADAPPNRVNRTAYRATVALAVLAAALTLTAAGVRYARRGEVDATLPGAGWPCSPWPPWCGPAAGLPPPRPPGSNPHALRRDGLQGDDRLALRRGGREGYTPGPRGGRPPITHRQALTGILFVLRTGIPWENLPAEMGCGSGMSCWRRQADGTWTRLHAVLLERLHNAGKLDWSRAAIDSSSVRAVFGRPPPAEPHGPGQSGQ